jgi:LacI family transcriptional regulator
MENSIKKVTLKDLAKKTGYSINTISRALKDKEDISLSTRKQIKKLAAETGYIPDVIAGSLRSNSTKTIAVILGDISNPYFGIVVKGIEDTARENGYHVVIANTNEIYENEEEIIKTLLGKRVDGFIILPVQDDSSDIKILKKRGVPLVLLGRYFKDISTSYVISNDITGGYLATKYLIEKGHREILVITGPPHISCARERLQGYLMAMKEANIALSKDLICELSSIRGTECHARFMELLKNRKFTAVFAFSDFLAFQVLYTLEELGLK